MDLELVDWILIAVCVVNAVNTAVTIWGRGTRLD